jgi:hypothetical protein
LPQKRDVLIELLLFERNARHKREFFFQGDWLRSRSTAQSLNANDGCSIPRLLRDPRRFENGE